MSSYDYTTRYTRDEKKEVLGQIIVEAWTEQHTGARSAKRSGHYDPFEVTSFRTQRIDHLVDVLRNTDALELLAEMIGAIDEEVQ